MKKAICFLLAVLTVAGTFWSGGIIMAKAASYGTDDLQGIDVSIIQNKEHRAYVNAMLKLYLSDMSDGRVRSALERGKSAIFFFDGASDNTVGGQYANYVVYHLTAVCVVVKLVNGVPTVVFMDDCSSTIPDNPRKPELNEGTPVPTVTDGIYPVVSCNHHDSFAALHVKCYEHGGALRCTQNGSYIDCSYGINIHARGANSVYATSQSSTGCLLVGKTPATSSKYNEFMKVVTGIDNAMNNKFSTVAEDMGVVVVDHQLFKEQIMSIYGADSNHTAAQIAALLTANSERTKAKLELFSKDHEHSFSEPITEAAHPHRTYRVCACGAVEFLDEGAFREDCEICVNVPTDARFEEVLPFVCNLYIKETAQTFLDAAMTKPGKQMSPGREYSVIAVYATGACKMTAEGVQGAFYVPVSDVLFGDLPERFTAMKAEKDITTYKTPTGEEYGYVGAGDTFYVLNTSGTRTQVLYPVSAGYKLGWVSDAAIPYTRYTVKFDANGGEKAPAPQQKKKGRTLVLSDRVPTREGYTFAGWNTRKDGTGTSFLPGGEYEKDMNATLYAVWEETSPESSAEELPEEHKSVLPWVIGGAVLAVAACAAIVVLRKRRK